MSKKERIEDLEEEAEFLRRFVYKLQNSNERNIDLIIDLARSFHILLETLGYEIVDEPAQRVIKKVKNAKRSN